jgi:hypothetical protein
MATQVLSVSANFTATNALQPETRTPATLVALSDATPAQQFGTFMTLPASGTLVPLPVPSTWSSVGSVFITNQDLTGYAQVIQPGGGLPVGGGTTPRLTTAGANGVAAAILINSTYLSTSPTGTAGDTFAITVPSNAGGANAGKTYVFQGVTGTPTGSQFQVGGFTTGANLAAAINASTLSAYYTAVYDGSSFTTLTALKTGSLYNNTGVAFSLTNASIVANNPSTFTAQQLAPNGGTFAGTYGGLAPATYAAISPSSFLLASCDVNGVLANGTATQVYVWMTGV